MKLKKGWLGYGIVMICLPVFRCLSFLSLILILYLVACFPFCLNKPKLCLASPIARYLLQALLPGSGLGLLKVALSGDPYIKGRMGNLNYYSASRNQILQENSNQKKNSFPPLFQHKYPSNRLLAEWLFIGFLLLSILSVLSRQLSIDYIVFLKCIF